MISSSPITPPPELVEQWAIEAESSGGYSSLRSLAAKAAQWGADQQLEATDTWIRTEVKGRLRPANRIADDHRADMRPKPPSLKEQLLQKLEHIRDVADGYQSTQDAIDDLRETLEALPND
jgi:hypothetical protein